MTTKLTRRVLGHSLLHSLVFSLAPHCSLRSLTPELIGKRFMFMNWMRRFVCSFNPLCNAIQLHVSITLASIKMALDFGTQLQGLYSFNHGIFCKKLKVYQICDSAEKEFSRSDQSWQIDKLTNWQIWLRHTNNELPIICVRRTCAFDLWWFETVFWWFWQELCKPCAWFFPTVSIHHRT